MSQRKMSAQAAMLSAFILVCSGLIRSIEDFAVPFDNNQSFTRLEQSPQGKNGLSYLLEGYVMCSMCIGFMLIFLTGFASSAAIITPELQQVLQSVPPDEEVSVIVTLVDKIDVSRVQEQDKSRAEFLEALQRKAEATQEPLKTFVESRGAKRLRSLWIINGMAMIVRAEVIRELAQQPGVESIKLDTTLSVPGR